MTDCLFCKIAAKTIPAEFLYEDHDLFAIKDIAPQAPIHLLIITKKHLPNILAMQPADDRLIGQIHLLAGQLARAQGLAQTGFRLVNNCLQDGGQAVPHLHFHLLGGRQLQWPPG
jgi:histidine triad (HIT) family protein